MGKAADVRHIHQVDALRGIAALLVATVFHAHQVLGTPTRTGPLDGMPVFSWIHDFGWTLVDLFFLISGFIFAHVYLEEGRLKQGVTVRSFMIARIARLYPLHLATFLFVAALVTVSGTPASAQYAYNDAWHFMLNLLMLQEGGLNEGLSFNVPAWSISVEMICYVAFVCAALAGPRFLRAAAAILIAAGLLATQIADETAHHVGRGLVGYFCGYLLRQNLDKFRETSIALLIAFGVVALLLPLTWRMSSEGVFFSLTLWPAVILLALRMPLLSTKPFRWLGERSYSIYLLHAPLYMLLSVALFADKPVPSHLWLATSACSTALLLGLAHLSFRYFEDPARRWIRARAGSPATAPGTPAIGSEPAGR